MKKTEDQHILLPVDLSAHSVKTMHVAGALCAENRAHLMLLYVKELSPFLISEDRTTPNLLQELLEVAIKNLKKQAETISETYGVSVDSYVVCGSTSQEILGFISSHPTDIVISGLAEPNTASQATTMLRVASFAPCPVLGLSDQGSDSNISSRESLIRKKIRLHEQRTLAHKRQPMSLNTLKGHNMMRFCLLAASVVFLSTCAAPRAYTTFADWDANNTRAVERSEFVEAYTALDYFLKWSPDKSALGYPQFQRHVFNSLDHDKNNQLSKAEFDGQIKRFYFGLFNGNFKEWDETSDGSISQAEFDKHVSQSNLSASWDTNGDKSISEQEMAGGMFYVCDVNGDSKVNNMEFEIWRVNR